MGIKNLSKFLKEKYPQVYINSHISKYQFKRIAIDIYGVIYRYKNINANKSGGWTDSFIYLLMCLKSNNVHAVFVFDGKPPPEKLITLKKRADDRSKMELKREELALAIEKYHCTGEITPILEEENKKLGSKDTVASLLCPKKIDIFALERKLESMSVALEKVSPQDIATLKDLLTVFGFPFIMAPGEAETTCAHLLKAGKCDVMLTNDTDALVYGAKQVIFDFNSFTSVIKEVNLDKILEALGLTFEQFRDFCIMCKTDYNENMDGIGPVKSLDLIKKFGSIASIKVNKPNLDTSVLEVENNYRLFSLPDECKIEVPYCETKLDFQKVEEFLVKYNSRIKLDAVKKAYAPVEIVFDD